MTCRSRSSEKAKAGTEAEAIEDCCLLSALYGLLSLFSSITPGPPAQGLYCQQQQAGPFHISYHSRKCLSGLPTGQSDGCVFSIDIIFFSDDSGLCKVDKMLINTSQKNTTPSWRCGL